MIYTVTLNPSIDYITYVDDMQLNALNRMTDDRKLPGGKGINVSRILTQLDIDTTALGYVGGFTGRFLDETLQTEGIRTDFIPVAGTTRINVKIKSAGETEINGAGPTIAADEQEALKHQLHALKPTDIVVLSGSKPAGVANDFYAQLIAQLTDAGIPFVIDTTGEELEAAIPQGPLVIKPNHHELAELVGKETLSDAEIYQHGRELLERGAQFALISMADKGALLFTPEGIWQGQAAPGDVINSVGAGDSMIAGFVGTYSQTHDPLEAFKMSVACGSATAYQEDLATHEQIQAVYQTVAIKKVD
ncbi:1-phosphofructokinase [Lacticigenium naphthae]|uniref:1-phosphofructokinase n=1 Tax=Lacticigenium naphthae TaxID=515351 RepID=UPI00041107CB|nr:1-phosphofructokinase [Lacticigenium naphthae]